MPCCSPVPSFKESEAVFHGYVLRTTFEFARLFGVQISTNLREWSSERMEKFRLVISACIHLGCDADWSFLVDLPDSQLDRTVLVLSALISRRDDFGGGLVNAEYWMSALLDDKMWEYTRWVADHIIPVAVEEELVPVLSQAFLTEHVGIILANFDLPDRLIVFSKGVQCVYRKYRRKIGGAVGKQLNEILRSALQFPYTLLYLEITWKVIQEDSSNLGFRDSIEAIFNGIIEVVEKFAKKSLTVNHDVRAVQLLESLEFLLCCGWWLHCFPYGPPGTIERISAVNGRIERIRADLLD